MATFAAYVVVHGNAGPVMFSPGETIPEWAEDLVGAHCLAPEDTPAPDFTAAEVLPAGDIAEVEAAADDEEPEDTPAPDFTAAVPRRGRPRKQ